MLPIVNAQQSAKIDVNKIAEIIKPLASLLLGIGSVVLVVVTIVVPHLSYAISKFKKTLLKYQGIKHEKEKRI